MRLILWILPALLALTILPTAGSGAWLKDSSGVHHLTVNIEADSSGLTQAEQSGTPDPGPDQEPVVSEETDASDLPSEEPDPDPGFAGESETVPPAFSDPEPEADHPENDPM